LSPTALRADALPSLAGRRPAWGRGLLRCRQKASPIRVFFVGGESPCYNTSYQGIVGLPAIYC